MSKQSYADVCTFSQHPLFRGKSPLLGHLDIELTERCNNSCQHCYINLPASNAKAASRELTTGQWKDILSQAAELGALSVRFTGGEPLLRQDFPEIYLFARRLGMQVVLFTNSRLINSKVADLFVKTPPLKKIEVSVYGMRPSSYDAIAGVPGAFTEFRRGIDLLLERKIPFVVKPVLLGDNRSEIKEFEAWSATIPWIDRDPTYVGLLDFRTRRDSPSRNRLINKLRISPEELVHLIAQLGDKYRREMARFGAGFMRPPGNKLFSCGSGESGCIDAYGKYQMCMLLRHPDTVYDLRKGSIRQALTEFFPSQRDIRATNPEYLARCARCFLKGLCEQCPGKSWEEHGTLDTPVEYLCQVAHAQASHLGLITEGEYAWEVKDWQQRIENMGRSVKTETTT
ncbi:radical SAM/SPASM domain-containing protein [Chloroflexota bacterium]